MWTARGTGTQNRSCSLRRSTIICDKKYVDLSGPGRVILIAALTGPGPPLVEAMNHQIGSADQDSNALADPAGWILIAGREPRQKAVISVFGAAVSLRLEPRLDSSTHAAAGLRPWVIAICRGELRTLNLLIMESAISGRS